jgi:hypothetical protein
MRDFRRTLEALLGKRDVNLSESEWRYIMQRYAHCHGTERWRVWTNVHPLAEPTLPTEHWVVRGDRIQDVYRSTDGRRAAAVSEALNELAPETPDHA